jgi:hypothetical protein
VNAERQALSNLWTVRQAYKVQNGDEPHNGIEIKGRKVLDRLPFTEYLLKQIAKSKYLTKEESGDEFVVYPNDRTLAEAEQEGRAFIIKPAVDVRAFGGLPIWDNVAMSCALIANSCTKVEPVSLQ